jgi:hypothetical protein
MLPIFWVRVTHFLGKGYPFMGKIFWVKVTHFWVKVTHLLGKIASQR